VKALLVLVVLAATAHATGVCENTERRYGKPVAFSEKDQAFAVPGVQPWCDEVDDGGVLDEKRGETAFTELRDIKGHVLAVLTESTDTHGAFDHVASIKAELARRGYKAVAPAHCTITRRLGKAKPVDGWPALELQIEERVAGSVVKRASVGSIAEQRSKDVVSVAHVTGKQLVVWTLVPTCGGPPPGYFSPDDGGVCYPQDTPVITVLDGARCL
jgi:hypothetical protein